MKLTDSHISNLLETLKTRFEKNMHRHPLTKWADVEKKVTEQPKKLEIIFQMEATGGEPDVVDFESMKGALVFVDCSIESPKDRRSYCYDAAALQSRKEHKPKSSAVSSAQEIGITLLDETLYRELQTSGEYDTKTSSWILTPSKIRKLGGAVFADRRYDTVFIYHNGAESYYAARGFRGYIKL